MSFFSKLKKTISNKSQTLGDKLSNILYGKKVLDAEIVGELETILIEADVGVDATNAILEHTKALVARNEVADKDAILEALKAKLIEILTIPFTPKEVVGPEVIMLVGINGAGKTTTIGKLAKLYEKEGKKVMLAAGDTFRAAAIEQLQAWGEKNKIPVVSQHTGADSASVIFDAYTSAKAKNYDVLLVDTAGRLHTASTLMDELKKIKRVLQKIDSNAPHKTLLILDASIGQNAIEQTKQFKDNIGVDGIIMSKLDGTAKGGILFAIAQTFKIPFCYLGVGEHIDDLKEFNPKDFVEMMINHDYFQAG